MDQEKYRTETEALADKLTAISITSRRLASRLRREAARECSLRKGEKTHERNCTGCRRT